jgi:acetoin utilization protein AcuB
MGLVVNSNCIATLAKEVAMLRVQDAMTEGVLTVSPTTAAQDAWNLMRGHNIHHLVVTEGGQAVGVLSDADLAGPRGAADQMRRTAGELMQALIVAVTPETPIRKAANLMRGRSISCLVVERLGHVVGIVTVSDLLALLGGGLAHPVVANKRWTLKHRTPHRKAVRATGIW